ncbi:MAG: polyprenol monophosphomannose synthase [Terriglobales bacterium]
MPASATPSVTSLPPAISAARAWVPRVRDRRIARSACCALVLPTYNEAVNLPLLLPRLFAQQERLARHTLHVVVVDDESPDGTATVVREWMQREPRLHLLSGPKRGLGEAYQRGFAYALGELHAELVVQMDADLQHDPGLIPLFVTACQSGFEVVIGSRFVPGGALVAFSWRRRLSSRVGNWLLRVVSRLPPLHDYTSGYRCLRAESLAACDLRGLATRGYAFQSSLLGALLRRRARVLEVPIVFAPRQHGSSKLGRDDYLEFLRNLGRLRRYNTTREPGAQRTTCAHPPRS